MPSLSRRTASLLRACHFGLCAALLLTCAAAQASLGQGVASIYTAQQQLVSSLTVEPGRRYSVYTHSLSNGTAVREYLSPQDEVFAVVWQGSVWPDLAVLLGSYYDRFVQLMKQRRAGQAATDSTLVVESSGHMGALKGRIYLPAKLPAGVLVSELK